ncbi:MAG: peptidylprolyl isomerase [Bacteroidota bacterium]
MQRLLYIALSLALLNSCARPIANFAAQEEAARAATPISFSNQSEKAESYLWEFGDGQTSKDSIPEHRYMASGTYTVKLTAFDAKGKTGTKEKEVTILPPDRCLVSIETPEGNMLAEIYDRTPLHQDNFVKLVEQGFYDSLLFHRVIDGFMIQGGDPDSRGANPGAMLGSGGPGYTIQAEFVDSLAHVKGALAAARTNNPQKRSSGSQFYIVQGRATKANDLDAKEGRYGFRYPSYIREEYMELGGTPFLDQEYTVFGKVIEGLDVIDRIATVRTSPQNRPENDVWMVIKLIR